MKNAHEIPSLGEQENLIFQYISNFEHVCVRDVALHFETEKGLARTTVLTVMERLRKKGFLNRIKKDSLYVYSTKIETHNIIKSKVSNFVEKTLGGSISPLLNYFAENKNISEAEILQLQDILKKINTKGES